MTNISINISIDKKQTYCSNCVTVTVSCHEEIKLKNKTCTGFKCYVHSFNGISNSRCKCELKFCNGYVTCTKPGQATCSNRASDSNQRGCIIPSKNGKGNVYVFFYGEKDPRPLLVFYNGKAYRPRTKELYFEKWINVREIKNCVCDGKGTCDNCCKLLQELVRVVGFLNTVNLSKHPSSTSTNGQCNTGSVASESTANTCNTTEKNDTCTYPVHKYGKGEIKVKVTCSDVPPDNGTSCYKKLNHTHNGINGANPSALEGFRLGDVVYNKGRSEKGRIEYYSKGTDKKNWSEHWCKPLVKVEAYFYDQDKNYSDPLLVVLEFKNGSGNDTDKEYYKLTERGEGNMTWQIDPGAKSKVEGKCDDIINHLDGIRYRLKQVLRVEIACKINYPLKGRNGNEPAGIKEFEQLINCYRSTEVKVEVFEKTCVQLSGTNYKCYWHQIESALSGIHDEVAGLAFTIPGQDGSVIEIKLYGEDGQKMDFILYNKCMGDIFVYFYGEDPRPLLLCYDNKAFTPFDKDDYFNEWVYDETIKCVCSEPGEKQNEPLLNALTEVVGFLNPVRLNNVPLGCRKCRFYTIHWFGGCRFRIKVEKIISAKDGFCYNGYMHTHLGTGCNGEGFRLGNIVYMGECIQLNGDSNANGKCITSQLDNGDSSNKYTAASKVLVFYYQGDRDLKMPLLVALCQNSKNDECNLYYELILSSCSTRVGSDTDPKRYRKCTNSITLCETSGGTLVQKLDNVMCQIRKTLQIILDQLPMPKLYCPKEDSQKAPVKFKCEPRKNGHTITPAKPGSTSDDIIPASYEAQLYDKDGKQLTNVCCTSTDTNTSNCNSTSTLSPGIINVTEIKCMELNTYGYKCYMHDIVNAKFIVEIGWLRFFLWDNGGGSSTGTKSPDGSISTCGATTTGPSCPSGANSGGAGAGSGAGCTSDSGGAGVSGSKELCLYKECSGASRAGSSSCTTPDVSTEPAPQSTCTATVSTESVSGNSCTTPETPSSSLPFNTCKGNVYVFFYGDDPRPLMLCYAGNAYGPKCLEEYECRWV